MNDASANTPDVHAMRRSYARDGLDEQQAGDDPMALFSTWFNQSLEAAKQLPDADWVEVNAMTLATVDPDGKPAARVMLLKDFSDRGFTFYTNFRSRKGEALAHNPAVALVFFWGHVERQVRIEGVVEKLPIEEAEAYFHSRPAGSQVGAWASPQSQPIEGRDVLERRVAELQERYGDEQPPLPEFWGGYLVRPESVEFWQGRPSRLHDRIRFTRDSNQWARQRLAP